MRESRKLSGRLLVIECWIWYQLLGYVSSEPYSLATPQPESGKPLETCVFVLEIKDILDPDTGLLDVNNLPSGSLLAPSYTTQCVSRHTGVFELDIQQATQRPAVQLTDTGSDLHDVFLPFPNLCLGREYVVATWTPGDISYVAMFNPNDHTISVSIDLGPHMDVGDVLVDGKGVTQTHDNVITILAGELSYVTSDTESLDGVAMSSVDNFGVLAGNTGTQVFGFGVESNFLEMFPPKDYFSDEYVVPLPPSTSHCAVKVISLSEDSPVDVTLTDLLEGSPSTSTVSNTLTELGSSWTHTHSNALHVKTSGPVLVAQFKPETSFSHASSMTLVPPTTKWVWSAALYPLTFSESDGFDEHLAVVNIKTNHVAGLVAYNLYDGSDVTSSLTFTPFDDSEYSHTEIALDTSYIILLQHTDYQTFQVIQYGSSSSVEGLYSFPATWNMSCPPAEEETTSTTDTASIISDIHIYIFICGFVVLVAMGAIIGLVCGYYHKNKRNKSDNKINSRGILFQEYNTNKKKPNPHSVFHGNNNKNNNKNNNNNNKPACDTAKRRDIELPRVLHVKPLKQ